MYLIVVYIVIMCKNIKNLRECLTITFTKEEYNENGTKVRNSQPHKKACHLKRNQLTKKVKLKEKYNKLNSIVRIHFLCLKLKPYSIDFMLMIHVFITF